MVLLAAKGWTTLLMSGASSILAVVLTLPPLAAFVHAAEGYRFPQSCSDCWPGWTVVQDPQSGRQISASPGRGQIVVEGISQYHGDNQQHLLWDGSEGASSATLRFAFDGTQDTEGWYAQFTAPSPCGDVLGQCDFVGVPVVNADEAQGVLIYTSADGLDWLGAFAGLPSALNVGNYPLRPPAELMTGFYLIQSVRGVRTVLGMETVAPALRMGEQAKLRIEESGGFGIALLSYGTKTWRLRAPLVAPPYKAGKVGVFAVVSPASSCTSGPLRVFGYYGVSL